MTEEKLKMIEPIYDSFENEDIKDFCKLLVSELPLYWWEVPASSTGKYHPAYALGDGGLMRHSIAVVRFLNWFFSLEQYQNKFTDRERDLLRCAGLVHDGRKSGASDDVKEVFTVFDHPLLMAEAVRKHKEDAVISDKEIELIANAIESHMGQWTTSNKPKDAGIVLPKPSNKYQEIVDNMLGWDITDFGTGDFEHYGLTVFTFRNGNFHNKEKYPKPYAEKLLLVNDGQILPYHYHWSKMEDIINRGGGDLELTLYNATPADFNDVEGGRSGKPGTQGQYHTWRGVPGTGKVMLFEVSMTNDDHLDNRFKTAAGRIPEVEEDEEIEHLMFADYDKVRK